MCWKWEEREGAELDRGTKLRFWKGIRVIVGRPG